MPVKRISKRSSRKVRKTSKQTRRTSKHTRRTSKPIKGGAKRRTTKRLSKKSNRRSSCKTMKGGAKTVLPIVSPDAFKGVARIYDDDNIPMIKLHAGQSAVQAVKDFGVQWDKIWKDFSRPIDKQTPPRYQVSKPIGDFLNEIKGKSLLKYKGKDDAWDLS